jgi:hypothetical protein
MYLLGAIGSIHTYMPSAKRAGELLSLSRNQLRIMMGLGLLTGHYYLKGHLFKVGLVDSPECDRRKQAFGTARHVLCECEALAVYDLGTWATIS